MSSGFRYVVPSRIRIDRLVEQASGVAKLGSDGKIAQSAIPAIPAASLPSGVVRIEPGEKLPRDLLPDSTSTLTYPSIAALKTAVLAGGYTKAELANVLFFTSGYTADGDGGGNVYTVVTDPQLTSPVDMGYYIPITIRKMPSVSTNFYPPRLVAAAESVFDSAHSSISFRLPSGRGVYRSYGILGSQENPTQYQPGASTFRMLTQGGTYASLTQFDEVTGDFSVNTDLLSIDLTGTHHLGATIDLGLPSDFDVSGFVIQCDSVHPHTAPRHVVLLGSNDRFSWNVLNTREDLSWSTDTNTINFGQPHRYLWYRLVVKATTGFVGAVPSSNERGRVRLKDFRVFGNSDEDVVYLKATFPSNSISYVQFGADPTGATRSEGAIHAAHAVANRLGLPVLQTTGSFMYMSDRRAAVKTDTNLAGATFTCMPILRTRAPLAGFTVNVSSNATGADPETSMWDRKNNTFWQSSVSSYASGLPVSGRTTQMTNGGSVFEDGEWVEVVAAASRLTSFSIQNVTLDTSPTDIVLLATSNDPNGATFTWVKLFEAPAVNFTSAGNTLVFTLPANGVAYTRYRLVFRRISAGGSAVQISGLNFIVEAASRGTNMFDVAPTVENTITSIPIVSDNRSSSTLRVGSLTNLTVANVLSIENGINSILAATPPDPYIDRLPISTIPEFGTDNNDDQTFKNVMLLLESRTRYTSFNGPARSNRMVEPIQISKTGYLSAPVYCDFNEVGGVSINRIVTPEDEWLTFQGGNYLIKNTPTSGVVNCIRIRRPQTVLSNIRYRMADRYDNGDGSERNHTPFVVEQAFNVHLENIYGEAFFYESLGAPYSLTISQSLNVTVRNFFAHRGWGTVITNNAKNTVFDNCSTNRTDAHLAAFNMTVSNCVMAELQCNYNGWGRMIFKDCLFQSNATIQNRADYPPLWNGDLEVRNCKFSLNAQYIPGLPLIRIGRYVTNNYLMHTYFTRSVNIENIVIDAPASVTHVLLCLLTSGTSGGGSGKLYYPENIRIRNVRFSSSQSTRPALTALAVQNLQNATPIRSRLLASAENVHSSNDYNMNIDIQDCESSSSKSFLLLLPNSAVSNVEVSSTDLTQNIATPTDTLFPPDVIYANAAERTISRVIDDTGTSSQMWFFEVEGAAYGNGRLSCTATGTSGGEFSSTSLTTSHRIFAFEDGEYRSIIQYTTTASGRTNARFTRTNATHDTYFTLDAEDANPLTNKYYGFFVELRAPHAVYATSFDMTRLDDPSKPRIANSPYKYRMYGSNDRVNWYQLKNVDARDWSANPSVTTVRDYIDRPGWYLYYRLVVNELNGNSTDAEGGRLYLKKLRINTDPGRNIRLYPPFQASSVTAVSGGYSFTMSGLGRAPKYGGGTYIASASSTDGADNVGSTTSAFNAFRDQYGTSSTDVTNGVNHRSWISSGSSNEYDTSGSATASAPLTGTGVDAVRGAYLQLQLPTNTPTGRPVAVIMRVDTSLPYWQPVDFAVFGSGDGATWEKIATKTNQTWTLTQPANMASSFQEGIRQFDFVSQRAYFYYRVVVSRVSPSPVVDGVSVPTNRVKICRMAFITESTAEAARDTANRAANNEWLQLSQMGTMSIYPKVSINNVRGGVHVNASYPCHLTISNSDVTGVAHSYGNGVRYLFDNRKCLLKNCVIRGRVQNSLAPIFNFPSTADFSDCVFYPFSSSSGTKVVMYAPSSLQGHANRFEESGFWLGEATTALSNRNTVTVEQVDKLPPITSATKGTIIYHNSENVLYFGTGSGWVKLQMA